MGERLAAVPLTDDAAVEARAVVPVPTTRSRIRSRGYNQAELLAREFARRTGRTVVVALERASGTTQTALQPVARGANVAGAFRASAAAATLREAHVILVDDVLTTGATILECARALSDSGVRCVSAITFARALDVRRLVNT